MRFLLIVELVLVFLMLGLSLIILTPENVKAQQSNNSKDPDQLKKEFKEGMDTIQNNLGTDFGELLNVIKAQLNFSSV
ncbi:MAG: hypothetical protein WB511_11610, partial [Nitrososphaeraceae archaeon]